MADSGNGTGSAPVQQSEGPGSHDNASSNNNDNNNNNNSNSNSNDDNNENNDGNNNNNSSNNASGTAAAASNDKSSTGGQMPPPPIHIPPHTNPIPTSITSPILGHDQSGMMSPNSASTYRRAAPEPNKRALYVGGLDPRVTEDMLRQIFETSGHVQNVKIIPDKGGKGHNYGFVEYDDPGAAERAMSTLSGRRVHQSEIKVNWAYQSGNSNKEDTSNHYHIFVGDLSNEVNDESLFKAFSAVGVVSEARVKWDMKTGHSRGYGFVSFRDRADAEKALGAMDGVWLGTRPIRCNWANQKGQPSVAQMQAMGMTPTSGNFGHHNFPTQGMQSYNMVAGQTPAWQKTCYVGNLTPATTQNDLVPLFQNFGYVTTIRLHADRGFAFIQLDTHEHAAMAICQMNGYIVNGRPLKCSWGKDKHPDSQNFDPNQPFSPQGVQTPGFPPTPTAFYSPHGRQFGGPQAQSPAGYSPMGGYGGPSSAAGYGRGQMPNQWQGQQTPQAQTFGGTFNGGFQS